MTRDDLRRSAITRSLFPPTTLIKESLSRYKPVESSDKDAFVREEKTTFEETIFEHPTDNKKSEDENEE